MATVPCRRPACEKSHLEVYPVPQLAYNMMILMFLLQILLGASLGSRGKGLIHGRAHGSIKLN